MPHILIDYSANLDADFDIRNLAKAVHERALATGVFPVGGTRTRVERREIYVIGDGHLENRYIHVQARIGIGRSPDVRQKVAEDIFSVVKDFTAATFTTKPLGLTLEIVEIDPVGALRHNNLHEIIAARQAKTFGEAKTAGGGN